VETWSRLNKLKNSTTTSATTPINRSSSGVNNNSNGTGRVNSQNDSTARALPLEKEDLRYGARDMKQWKGDPEVGSTGYSTSMCNDWK